MAEMLGWCDPTVREHAFDATYFDPDEMPTALSNQAVNRRLDILTSSLRNNWGIAIADAFGRAWNSPRLADCPAMSEWNVLVGHAAINW